ncbi:MAG TPA: glycosyltransferase, partial [Thermoanaerobaculia bacterium]|nr:glycosyltransferase [Thermoanaerobaculia bacterium]
VTGARRGKGRAVHDGIMSANGDAVALIDADLEVLLPHLTTFVERVRSGFDVVIAERTPHWRNRNLIRLFLSYGLYVGQRLFIFNSFRFQDTQCGFKAFAGPIAKKLAAKQRVDGGMYDIEYLYAAVQNALRIDQVPVGEITETRPSRLRLLKCLRTDPLDLLAIKWRGLLGWYRIGR